MFLSGFNYNEKCAFFSLAKNIAEADENISKVDVLSIKVRHFALIAEHRFKEGKTIPGLTEKDLLRICCTQIICSE